MPSFLLQARYTFSIKMYKVHPKQEAQAPGIATVGSCQVTMNMRVVAGFFWPHYVSDGYDMSQEQELKVQQQ